jgi:thermitase
MVPGWNVYDNNADTVDVQGHGTAVAGTAAAAGNNAIGVASVAWQFADHADSYLPTRPAYATG